MESEFKSYGVGLFSDSLSNKGVLHTKIKIKDQYVNVFNTHLNASYISTDLSEIIIFLFEVVYDIFFLIYCNNIDAHVINAKF